MKQSFYGTLPAREYDIGTDVSRIMRFYIAEWKRIGRPEPVLEPMCGTGLNMVWFLQEGADTDGLDASKHMLAQCAVRLEAQGFHSTLYEQNLEEMALPRQYGLIFIPGGSFGHIYDKEVALACLKRIRDSLQPGGWFIVDARQPAFMARFGADGQVDHSVNDFDDDATVLTTAVWQHHDDGRVIRCWNKMEQFAEGRLAATEVFDYWERLYEEAELRAMLDAVGFTEIHVTREFEPNGPEGNTDGILFTCRR